jgi:hypothetical protein
MKNTKQPTLEEIMALLSQQKVNPVQMQQPNPDMMGSAYPSPMAPNPGMGQEPPDNSLPPIPVNKPSKGVSKKTTKKSSKNIIKSVKKNAAKKGKK